MHQAENQGEQLSERDPILDDQSAAVIAAWPAGLPRELRYPHGLRPISDYLRQWARIHPDKPALVFYGTVLSYAELDRASEAFAHHLLAQGVKPGDRVAIMLPNCPQYVIAFHGILKAGAVYTPVSPLSKTFEMSHQLVDSGAKVVLVQDRLMPLARQARSSGLLDLIYVTALSDMLPAAPDLPVHSDLMNDPIPCADAADFLAVIGDPAPAPLAARPMDDISALNYTGGTTGLPKGCIHTHFNQLYTAAASRFHAPGDPTTEVALNFLPQFWIAGENSSLLAPVLDGATLVLMSRWDPEAVVRAINRFGITQLTLPVDVASELIARPDFRSCDFARLRTVRIISLTRKLTIELRRDWEQVTGVTPFEASYGMTETHTGDTFTVGMQQDDFDLHARPLFVGLPVPGTRIKIADFETGETLPAGAEGEICVATPSAMKGYWSNREATADMIRNGWVHTGDLGMLSPGGHLHYLGRRKEMIKVNGMSVFPAEVEAVLGMHHAVETVAVVPRTHHEKGQVPVAFVRLRAPGGAKARPISSDEIADWCRTRLSVFKVPEIRIVEEFPMTGTGKIKRLALAQIAEETGSD